MFTIGDIIDLGIRIEENAERIYRDAAQGLSDSSIASMLRQLADDEVKHAQWLSELKAKVNRTVEDPQAEEMGKRLLQGVLGDQSFSLKEVRFSTMREIEDVLKVAIEFQEDTVLFYEMIRSFIEGKETLDHLDAIIKEENDHIRLLQESLDLIG